MPEFLAWRKGCTESLWQLPFVQDLSHFLYFRFKVTRPWRPWKSWSVCSVWQKKHKKLNMMQNNSVYNKWNNKALSLKFWWALRVLLSWQRRCCSLRALFAVNMKDLKMQDAWAKVIFSAWTTNSLDTGNSLGIFAAWIIWLVPAIARKQTWNEEKHVSSTSIFIKNTVFSVGV